MSPFFSLRCCFCFVSGLLRAPGYVTKGWGRDTPLWEAIAGLTWEHYEEHYPNFAEWSPGASDTTAARAR